ncbi:hypothetical protein K504DRAFT_449403 [Pleomassaria siparia CBS 279.74]|uniref:Uncharacterized protein n=1 Tax=Pleomassaria siparia CBS 279.74 TaxID=1314801 RepID=A0A6G1JUU8_9PLEO|nr:hypothetical protein K504DRAFT_449403 [Pleomassaria siparia CBS 279.74]
MANSPSGIPTMISDGKRMRVVWTPGDGDGDPSTYLVEKAMNIIKGHPTWKIFIGDVKFPIGRGSTDEPPHYIYLDDQACYIISCSNEYSNDELKDFWPFDFNAQGAIKTGRKNRGRLAYVDDSHSEIAKARLRGKNKWYYFTGDPAVTDYKSIRPNVLRMEREVAAELSEHVAEGVDIDDIFQTPIDEVLEPIAEPVPEPTPEAVMAPCIAPVPNTNHLYPETPTLSKRYNVPAEIPVHNVGDLYPSKPTLTTVPTTKGPAKTSAPKIKSIYPAWSTSRAPQSTPFLSDVAFSLPRPESLFQSGLHPQAKALALPPRVVTGSPYGTIVPASHFRSIPRPVRGDLGNVFANTPAASSIGASNPKRSFSECHPFPTEPTNPTTPLKRAFVIPFDISSSDSSPPTPPFKRVQLDPAEAPCALSGGTNLGSDGANDDEFGLADVANANKVPLDDKSKLAHLAAYLSAT